jgi:hypothetical protein
MRLISLFLFFLSCLTLYSEFTYSQDCPNNTLQTSGIEVQISAQYFVPIENWVADYLTYRNNNGIDYSSVSLSSDCNNGTIAFNATFQNGNTATGTRACQVSGNSVCSCSGTQIASTDSNGNVTACSDLADVPDPATCQDSIDAYLGTCGSAPEDCENGGGQFGFVNSDPEGGASSQAVCVPQDYSGGGGSGQDCSQQETLYLGNGGDDASCVENIIPNNCANDNDCDGIADHDDPTPNGDGISSGQQGSPASTGGTKTDPQTGEPIIDDETGEPISCNPLTDGDCSPDGHNSGAGQCDPESFKYLSCLIKKPKKGNVITKLDLTDVQTDIVNAQLELTTLLGEIETEFSASIGSVSNGTARLPSVVKTLRGQDVEFGFSKFKADISVMRNIFLIVASMAAIGIVLRGRSDG